MRGTVNKKWKTRSQKTVFKLLSYECLKTDFCEEGHCASLAKLLSVFSALKKQTFRSWKIYFFFCGALHSLASLIGLRKKSNNQTTNWNSRFIKYDYYAINLNFRTGSLHLKKNSSHQTVIRVQTDTSLQTCHNRLIDL